MMHKDEDVELGLAKKYLLLTHEEGKNSQEGSGPEPGSKEEGHGDKQAGETEPEQQFRNRLQNNCTNRHQHKLRNRALN